MKVQVSIVTILLLVFSMSIIAQEEVDEKIKLKELTIEKKLDRVNSNFTVVFAACAYSFAHP